MQNAPITMPQPQIMPQQGQPPSAGKKPSRSSLLLSSVGEVATTMAIGAGGGLALGAIPALIARKFPSKNILEALIAEVAAADGRREGFEEFIKTALKKKNDAFKEAKKYAGKLTSAKVLNSFAVAGALGFALYKVVQNFLPQKQPPQTPPSAFSTQG